MSSNPSAKKASAPRVNCKFVAIDQVSVTMMLEMHAVFIQYYHNANLETFIKDMSKKSGVFVLRDQDQNRIIGFSTYTEMNFEFKGRKSIGIFSGDTVVEKAYWGNKALQTAFALKLAKTKFLNPTHHVFWLLISKGYKTYLLLTNNFPRHYPTYRQDDAEMASVVDLYCNSLFPEYYDSEKRVLDFGDTYQRLKGDVADITPEMRLQDPNIRFFDDRNFGWRRGTELPCVGEITFSALVQHLKKRLSGKSARGAKPVTANAKPATRKIEPVPSHDSMVNSVKELA